MCSQINVQLVGARGRASPDGGSARSGFARQRVRMAAAQSVDGRGAKFILVPSWLHHTFYMQMFLKMIIDKWSSLDSRRLFSSLYLDLSK